MSNNKKEPKPKKSQPSKKGSKRAPNLQTKPENTDPSQTRRSLYAHQN